MDATRFHLINHIIAPGTPPRLGFGSSCGSRRAATGSNSIPEKCRLDTARARRYPIGEGDSCARAAGAETSIWWSPVRSGDSSPTGAAGRRVALAPGKTPGICHRGESCQFLLGPPIVPPPPPYWYVLQPPTTGTGMSLMSAETDPCLYQNDGTDRNASAPHIRARAQTLPSGLRGCPRRRSA
jgi:hypothetical protein